MAVLAVFSFSGAGVAAVAATAAVGAFGADALSIDALAPCCCLLGGLAGL